MKIKSWNVVAFRSGSILFLLLLLLLLLIKKKELNAWFQIDEAVEYLFLFLATDGFVLFFLIKQIKEF